MVEHKLHIAPPGNVHRVCKRLVRIGKELTKGLLTFDVKFLCLKLHPVGVIHGFGRLDAQEHILNFGVLLPEVMGVVGHHHRKPRLP